MNAPQSHGKTLIRAVETAGVPLLMLTFVAFFCLYPATSPYFGTEANIKNILSNQSVTALVAIAMVVPLVAGYFDLSVSAIAGLSNVLTAALLGTYSLPIPIAIAIAVLVSGLAGLVNGYLVASLKLDPLIVTLGTYSLLAGALQWYTKGQTLNDGIPLSFGNWGSSSTLGVPQPFWLLLAVAVVTWYALAHTPGGRRLAALGSNESAARLAGIRVDRSIFVVFCMSGAIAGIAGVLLTSRTGSASPGDGPGYLFPALAAVFIGMTTIQPGRYNVWGTMFGVYLLAVTVNGFALLGAQGWVSQLFNGLALVGSVALARVMTQFRSRSDRVSMPGGGVGQPPVLASPDSERGLGRLASRT